MAFDGSVVACLKEELERKILDGRILKVAQPEKDELILTIKKEGTQHRLMISVNPSLPLMYLTERNSASPLKAPAFCMLLRKHLQKRVLQRRKHQQGNVTNQKRKRVLTNNQKSDQR